MDNRKSSLISENHIQKLGDRYCATENGVYINISDWKKWIICLIRKLKIIGIDFQIKLKESYFGINIFTVR